MKHASNEMKHLPYLNGNPTMPVAIFLKQWHCQILVWALGLTMTTVKYDITLGTGEYADQDSCISNEKNQLILMGNFSRTCKEVSLIHITGGITLKTTLV